MRSVTVDPENPGPTPTLLHVLVDSVITAQNLSSCLSFINVLARVLVVDLLGNATLARCYIRKKSPGDSFRYHHFTSFFYIASEVTSLYRSFNEIDPTLVSDRWASCGEHLQNIKLAFKPETQLVREKLLPAGETLKATS